MPESQTHTIELTVKGMHCSNCALGVEKSLSKLGAREVSANFATSKVRVTLDGEPTVERVVKEIERLGYRVPTGNLSRSHGPLQLSLVQKLIFSLLWTIPLLLHMVLPIHALHDPWVQLGLCIPVFIVGFVHFGQSGLASLRSGVPNMDVLIFLGITAAFVYSLIGTLLALGPDYLFYETTATITTIVLLGNYLEERSVKKTSSAIEELSRMQPATARRVSGHGALEQIHEVEAEKIMAGDVLQVNTGDRVPVDGVILSGGASVDESMISGESVPVDRTAEDKAVGGTLLVTGSFRMRAVAVRENTLLAQMVKLVAEAQSDKPAIQRVGDRVAAVFVPAVVAIAGLTFALTLISGAGFGPALIHSIAVLVVACPCVLGLATPTAVMAGIGRSAQSGVLIRGGRTLEDLAQADFIVFDKTGTLTTGRFKLGQVRVFGGAAEAEARAVVAGLERHSSHPIAQSLVRELANVSPISISEVLEERGLGISGRAADGKRYELGSGALLKRRNVIEPDGGADLYLLCDGALTAALTLSDELKPGAKEAIDELHRLGIKTALLSGDRQEKCRALAQQVGIDEVYAEKLPQEKLEVLKQLQSRAQVAYVGDGVNDAPALAQAGVGISMSNASAAAIGSARVVLLNGEMPYLVYAVRIARRTFTIIKQNLFWAFAYNIIAIPAAALGLLNPTIAAFSMGCSDVVVVGNSLRLRLEKGAR